MTKDKGMYIRADLTHEEKVQLIKTAIANGAEEIHVGYQNCGICNCPISQHVSGLSIPTNSNVKSKVRLTIHLCEDCSKIALDSGIAKTVGRG